MTHPARFPVAGAFRASYDRWPDVDRNEVTEIIPFNEFGDLDDLEFSDNSTFDTEARVLLAPELDDLRDTDNLAPLRLAAPNDFQADPSTQHRTDPHPYRPHDGLDATAPIDLPQRGGQHRKPATGALKSRLLITAMAAGATAAAAHTATHQPDTSTVQLVLAADASVSNDESAATPPRGIQVVAVKPASNTAVHEAQLAKAVSFAEERAQREARLRRPLFVMPTNGLFTSNFGYRWGVLHAGIDIANAIGTPIYAVSDGVVIDAGPAAGYGMLVKLRHADGTVTLYGHVNTTLVSVGERVMAGDQIATMGNRGDATGPHLHFEVQLGGTDRVDPAPWLAQRGLGLGNYAG